VIQTELEHVRVPRNALLDMACPRFQYQGL
jgi:hypothetical protein